MKALLALSALLAGSTAFACPDLAGKYSCDSYGTTTTLNITQTTENDATTYTFQESDGSESWSYQLVSDNQKREQKNAGETLKYASRCENNALVTDIDYSNTPEQVTVVGAQTHSLEGTSLKIHMVGDYTEHGQKQPIDDTTTCARAR